jgi:hypothetical protein
MVFSIDEDVRESNAGPPGVPRRGLAPHQQYGDTMGRVPTRAPVVRKLIEMDLEVYQTAAGLMERSHEPAAVSA